MGIPSPVLNNRRGRRRALLAFVILTTISCGAGLDGAAESDAAPGVGDEATAGAELGAAGATGGRQTTLVGTYVRLGDEGRFVPCDGGETMPVARGGDHEALQSFYEGARRAPGDAVLVEVEARVEPPPAGADEVPPTIVVERFVGGWPGETCPVPGVMMPLEGNHWRLTRVLNEPVRAPGGDELRAPHLVLRDGRVTGSGGCNQLGGAYVLEPGEALAQGSLTFSAIAATRMACAEGMETEAAFLAALPEVRRFELAGIHLDLLDAAGNRLARLEVRAFF
jgi:heat shock protein HslJ